MDRKSVIVLAASFLLLLVWFWATPKLFPPGPAQPGTNATPPLTGPATTAPPANIASATTTAPPVLAVSSLTAPLPATEQDAQEVRLESSEAVYTFTSRGGGLKLVELKKYLDDPGRRSGKAAQGEPLVTLNARAATPLLALRGEGLEGGPTRLAQLSTNAIRIEQSLSNGLSVIKEFTILSNYLILGRVRVTNSSDRPVSLPEHSWAAGASSSGNAKDDPTMLGVFWHNGSSESQVAPSWFENRSFCMAGVPRPLYSAGAGNVAWVAPHDQFFTVVVLPASNHVASQVLVRRVELPTLPAVNGKTPHPFGYEASLVYPGAPLSPGQTLEREFTIYAGPKEYKTLSRFGHGVDVVMGYTGFFGWFAKALLLSMNGLYLAVPNYGIVIILITVIIKVLFWPLTQASTRSMKRMQALQPQMKALQEKYKADPAKMNKKLMEFMKENKVSPMGGCLPMMLQIPVFIGFYQMIRSAIELRGVHFLWATDLSRPDTIAFVPGLDFPINPLPLVMGVTMLWQARMTPATPGVDPMQQRIMKYMPMMFMVFLYNFSAGLTLYWTVQNLLTIAQMKLTKTTPVGAPAAATTLRRKP